MVNRIGFACKWSELGPKGIVSVPELNNSTTTVAWLKRQTKSAAEQKLWDLMTHNIDAVYRSESTRLNSSHSGGSRMPSSA